MDTTALLKILLSPQAAPIILFPSIAFSGYIGSKSHVGLWMGLFLGAFIPVIAPIALIFAGKKEALSEKLNRYAELLDNGSIDEAEYRLLTNALSEGER